MHIYRILIFLALVFSGCSTVKKEDVLVNTVARSGDDYYVKKVPLKMVDDELKNTFAPLNEINVQVKEVKTKMDSLTPCPENVKEYTGLMGKLEELKKEHEADMAKLHFAQERAMRLTALEQCSY